jgi:hypothetical protein
LTAGPTSCEGRDALLGAGLLKTLAATVQPAAARLAGQERLARIAVAPKGVATSGGVATSACRLDEIQHAQTLCCAVLAILRGCVLDKEAEQWRMANVAVQRVLVPAADLVGRLWPLRAGWPELQAAALELFARLAASPAAHATLLDVIKLDAAVGAALDSTPPACVPLSVCCA